MAIKDFQEESNIEIIKSLMKVNNGYVTSKTLSELGIHRMYLSIMQKKGMIERVGKGIYLDSSKLEDSYYVLSLSFPNAIFSHMTALYFHGLSIKAPNGKCNVTVKHSYNNINIKNNELFYVNDDIFYLGLTKVKTPMGNEVNAYDIERCICDVVRSKKRMDLEHVKYSIKAYLKTKDKDLVKLSKYAEKMGIKDEVMEFVSLFYE